MTQTEEILLSIALCFIMLYYIKMYYTYSDISGYITTLGYTVLLSVLCYTAPIRLY